MIADRQVPRGLPPIYAAAAAEGLSPLGDQRLLGACGHEHADPPPFVQDADGDELCDPLDRRGRVDPVKGGELVGRGCLALRGQGAALMSWRFWSKIASMGDGFSDVISRVWSATGTDDEAEAPLDELTTTGPRAVLQSAFDVTGLATATVAAATLAAARLLAARRAAPSPAVTVDSKATSAAFASEGLFAPVGWAAPLLWDPVAGNYRATDGWIRLHTNYA